MRMPQGATLTRHHRGADLRLERTLAQPLARFAAIRFLGSGGSWASQRVVTHPPVILPRCRNCWWSTWVEVDSEAVQPELRQHLPAGVRASARPAGAP